MLIKDLRHTLYLCASCHGETGQGYSAGGAVPGIGLAGFLNVASDDYIYKTIKIGRIGTAMRPMLGTTGLANLNDEDAHNIIAFLRSLEGNVVNVTDAGLSGEELYNINCAACHQQGGEGKAGFAPAIRNRDFLAIASDEFIRKTVARGRPGTSMVARPDLEGKQLDSIFNYLRSIPVSLSQEVHVNPNIVFAGNVQEGEETFNVYCASCHGDKGVGYSAGGAGPGIGLAGFLDVASDDYIYQTLKIGRAGTSMRPFLGSTGLANLDDNDAHNIIVYLEPVPET